MKLISWNVNGINSTVKKGLIDFMKKEDAEVYSFQETKASPDNADAKLKNLEGYYDYWDSGEEKGYSGIASYVKTEPLSVKKGIGVDKFDKEGRVLTLEYDKYFLLNIYFPNAGRGLKRLDYKLDFNNEFLVYAEELRETKPLVLCGDFNVAHEEKDLANPKSNEKNAGFTPDERSWFSKFLNQGYIDTYREFEQEGGHYTYWTYRYNAREKNIGWRIDYFIVSEELKDKLEKSYMMSDVMGSDHCPIGLKIDL
ncbi:MAG: exodeoxyribonuclease III [Candidatus Lokiarchaeota archaeon]|nr:exodeoxyribonuclease III [Candidatus Lokiarchaeota archaeon]MBD3341357.1 exodeoxyribonuclease III [Candidatus Lokiarchaeota archaeon]